MVRAARRTVNPVSAANRRPSNAPITLSTRAAIAPMIQRRTTTWGTPSCATWIRRKSAPRSRTATAKVATAPA